MPREYPSSAQKSHAGWRRSALAAGVAGSIAALGCVSIEGDVPEVVMTQHALAFDGSAAPTESGDMSQTISFQHPYQPLEIPNGVESDLRPVRLTVTAGQGVDDLAFIRGLSLVISTNDPQGPAAETLIEYSRDPSEPAGAELTIDAASRPNVIDYWVTGSTFYTLTVFGTLPPTAWTVDIDVTFSGRVKYVL